MGLKLPAKSDGPSKKKEYPLRDALFFVSNSIERSYFHHTRSSPSYAGSGLGSKSE